MILYNDFTLALSTDNKALFVASAHTIHMKQHGSKSVEMNPCEHRVHPRQPTQFNDNRSKENNNNALTFTISAFPPFPLFSFSFLFPCLFLLCSSISAITINIIIKTKIVVLCTIPQLSFTWLMIHYQHWFVTIIILIITWLVSGEKPSPRWANGKCYLLNKPIWQIGD